jgi:transcriptional antiterminator RfaH
MLVSSDEGDLGVKKKWYAIYTKSRAERTVCTRLLEQGIDSYLPIVKTLRQWSDRKKWVEKPLFNSYVFVYITQLEYYTVLKTDGVVKYICFEGKAVPIPDYQIENLRLIENSDADIEHSNIVFKEGERIQVTMGSMKGLKGELVKSGRKSRVLVRIDHISQNLLVNIPTSYLCKEN